MQDPLVGVECGCVHLDWKDGTQMAKPLVSDELWELVEPLIPKVPRRHRFPERKPSGAERSRVAEACERFDTLLQAAV